MVFIWQMEQAIKPGAQDTTLGSKQGGGSVGHRQEVEQAGPT